MHAYYCLHLLSVQVLCDSLPPLLTNSVLAPFHQLSVTIQCVVRERGTLVELVRSGFNAVKYSFVIG